MRKAARKRSVVSRKSAAQKRWIFLWEGGGYNTVHAATAKQAYARAREMGELKPGSGRTRKLVPVRSSVQPYTIAADRAQSAGFDGLRGARKGRCLKWSKGRKRCLKRA